MLERQVILTADASCFEYAGLALASFRKHNPQWRALVIDAGLSPDQAKTLLQFASLSPPPQGEDLKFSPEVRRAKGRLTALSDLPGPNRLILFLDPFTLTMGSVEPLIESFLASGKPIGIGIEDDTRFYMTPMGMGWTEGKIPQDFPGSGRWQQQPSLNPAVLLAIGDRACKVGNRCREVFDKLLPRFRSLEQTLLGSILYEDQVPLFRIPLRYHCFLFEEHLVHKGKPYLDPVLVGGEAIVIRHFCTRRNREALDRALNGLLARYPLTGAAPTADPSKCVVLVPVGGVVEPDCERGLQALERRGYAVRRAYGYSAIDFGRSAMASQALNDGFEELMWIDSDVGFRPEDVDKLRRHQLPICAGLYPKKDRKSFACHFIRGSQKVVFGAGGGLFEVLYAGFGFMHTRQAIYEEVRDQLRLPESNQRFGRPVIPWFLPELVPDEHGWWYLAEDYAFCDRARRCGFKVMTDTSIRLTHVGRHAFAWEDIGTGGTRYGTFELRMGPKPEERPALLTPGDDGGVQVIDREGGGNFNKEWQQPLVVKPIPLKKPAPYPSYKADPRPFEKQDSQASQPVQTSGQDYLVTSIVILTHNQLAFTKLCVESVQRYTDVPYELIFVDNASTDGTPEYLESLSAGTIIRNENNRGFPIAANQGMKAAKGEQILLLNNDTIATPGWLRRMLDVFRSDSSIGLVGPCSNSVGGKQQVSVSYDDVSGLEGFASNWCGQNRNRLVDTHRLVGFCLLIRRPVVERIGMLDEQFGIGTFEDDDYCRRALQAGFRAVIAYDVFVHHFGGQTFLGLGVEYQSLFKNNQALFKKKWEKT
jgi:GT2 family glycosyltransferase